MSGTEGLNPFPGLRSFEPDEAHLFFGREEQVDELLRRLRRTRFLAVVGSSGSGKSSLVRAGLIPALYGGYMVKAGSSWRIAVLRPGDGPIANLAAALADPGVLGTDGQPQEVQRALVEATLRRGERGLVDAYREARLPAYENLLVVVDQFEELFRFKRSSRRASAEEAAAFVKLLLEAARPEEVPTYVVLTMRSDFVGNCAEFYGLPEAINDGQYLIPRMTREQRRSAISGPVAVGGAEISPRLLTRLLNDVGSSPDQLPILQHALMRTWDWWERRHVDGEPVDLQHYEAIGTMAQALSLHAEEAFEELGSDRPCSVAEKVFKCLTQKDEEGKGIRVPTPVDEICAVTGCSRDEVVEVVEGFRRPGRSFLMPPAGVPLEGDTVVDISHESLMRVWARLRRWVDEEAEAAQSYLRLAAAAAAFQQGLTGLWRDPELQLAVQWREQSQPNEAWARRYDPSFARAMVFLDQSVQERSREVLRRERQQRRQLVRARLMLIAVTAAAFLMLLFGINAWVAKQDAVLREREAKLAAEEADRQRGNAERERLKAEQSFRAAEEARSAAERNQERAEAERAKANRQQDRATAEAAAAERARRQEEEARRQEQRSREEAEHARARAEEERQRAEASRQRAETSEQKALRLRTLEIAHGLALRAQRVQQGGNNQLAALAALEAYTLSRRNGGPAHDPEIYAALRLALGGLGAGVEQVVEGSRDAVRALAFGPDGQTVAAAGDDGAVWLLAERDGRSVRTPLRETGDSVRSLAMSSDGR